MSLFLFKRSQIKAILVCVLELTLNIPLPNKIYKNYKNFE